MLVFVLKELYLLKFFMSDEVTELTRVDTYMKLEINNPEITLTSVRTSFTIAFKRCTRKTKVMKLLKDDRESL